MYGIDVSKDDLIFTMNLHAFSTKKHKNIII